VLDIIVALGFVNEEQKALSVCAYST
jgi:hypothetical protein